MSGCAVPFKQKTQARQRSDVTGVPLLIKSHGGGIDRFTWTSQPLICPAQGQIWWSPKISKREEEELKRFLPSSDGLCEEILCENRGWRNWTDFESHGQCVRLCGLPDVKYRKRGENYTVALLILWLIRKVLSDMLFELFGSQTETNRFNKNWLCGLLEIVLKVKICTFSASKYNKREKMFFWHQRRFGWRFFNPTKVNMPPIFSRFRCWLYRLTGSSQQDINT